MADTTALKNRIRAAIKANDNQEITGPVLQQTLLDIVDELDLYPELQNEANTRRNTDTQLQNAINAIKANINNGYVYAGIATPSTTPVSGKVFYIATAAGTYTNFGSQVLTQGINILRYNGSTWSNQQVIGIDDEPTAESDNLVKSGGAAKMYGHYVENPEFVYVKTDNRSKILWAIKTDGTIYYGAGVPPQVIDYINEKITELSLDEYEDIVAFLDDLEKGDKTLQDLLDKKVDGEYVENPEFIEAKIDAEDKVLEGIQKDGTKVIGGDLRVLGNMEISGVSYKVIENPEYLAAWVDTENKVVFGLKTDGKTYVGDADFLDDVESIKAFLANFNDKNIDWDALTSITTIENPEYIEIKTDVKDKILEATEKNGTKLFSGDVKVLGSINISGINYKVVNNQEWLKAIVDSKNKIICGIKVDGTFYVVDINFLDSANKIKTKLAFFDTTYNQEFIEVELDAEDKILGGRKTDGTKFENIGFSTPKVSIDGHTMENIEDPEGRLQIGKDAEDKIFNYRKPNGTLVENVGIETSRIQTDSAEIQDVDIHSGNATLNRLKLTDEGMDSFKEDLENSGFSPSDNNYKSPNLPKYGLINIKQETFYLDYDSRVSSLNDLVIIKDFDSANRKSTHHYYIKSTLTSNNGAYSINESSVRLRFYAAKKVSYNSEEQKYFAKDNIKKINGICYYSDTLGYANGYNGLRNVVIDGYSVESEQHPELAEGAEMTISNIRVSEFTGPVCIGAWTVEDWDYNGGKKIEHKCVVDIDFGHFYQKDNVAIGIKFQGNSTMSAAKKGLRFTFYKNNTYAKKEKVRIGELIRLSGFNVKAYQSETSRIKEPILYRVFNKIWQDRPITNRFNWDNKVNGYYHGATGIIKSFMTRVNENGEFYGIYSFGLKKDEKNYMLDGEDESGFLLSGASGGPNAWGHDLPYIITSNYDEEMLDETSQSTITAMETWHHFINNRLYKGSDGNEYNISMLTDVDGTMYVTATLVGGEVVESSVSAELIEFNKENAPERLDVLGFIDYFIGLQTFIMEDSTHNNVMVYSDSEKKKIFPFFYDVDNSLLLSKHQYDNDIFEVQRLRNSDMTFWESFVSLYWDEIVNRYYDLRNTVLNVGYMNQVYLDFALSVPQSDYQLEGQKWGGSPNSSYFEEILNFLKLRFTWLDENYFKN